MRREGRHGHGGGGGDGDAGLCGEPGPTGCNAPVSADGVDDTAAPGGAGTRGGSGGQRSSSGGGRLGAVAVAAEEGFTGVLALPPGEDRKVVERRTRGSRGANGRSTPSSLGNLRIQQLWASSTALCCSAPLASRLLRQHTRRYHHPLRMALRR